MGRPTQMDIVRRAYELWKQAGQPDGKDYEFYYQAERELNEAANKGDEEPRTE
jgi:hypothetical protein